MTTPQVQSTTRTTMTNPSPPDWRGLCLRMADELDHYRQLLTDDRREVHPLAVEARAALAASVTSPPDWRGLCEELVDDLQEARDAVADWAAYASEYFQQKHDLQGELDRINRRLDRAREALAQPEPEAVGPPSDYIDPEHTGSDREMLEAFYAACRSEGGTADEIHLRGLRAVLARCGRPAPAPAGERHAAPVPVAVSERPWEREGWCHPEERWAWFYNRRVGWRDAIPPESLKPPTLFPYTHSLPFNALPLPSEEVE